MFHTKPAKDVSTLLYRLYAEKTKRAKLLNELSRGLEATVGGKSRISKLSNGLIKIGVLAIVFPEPIVSDLLGYLLITTGFMLRKLRKETIADLHKGIKGSRKAYLDAFHELRRLTEVST